MKTGLFLVCIFAFAATMQVKAQKVSKSKELSLRKYYQQADQTQRLQVKDTLFFNNDTILLRESPLLSFPEIKTKLLSGNPEATECKRGYIANWRIEDGVFLLQKFIPYKDNTSGEKMASENLLPLLSEIIGSPFENGSIKATWLNCKFAGGADWFLGGTLYKKEYLLTVKDGEVKNCKQVFIPKKKYNSLSRLSQYMVKKGDWNDITGKQVQLLTVQFTDKGVVEKVEYAPYLSEKENRRITQKVDTTFNISIASALKDLPEGSFSGYMHESGSVVNRLDLLMIIDPIPRTILLMEYRYGRNFDDLYLPYI